MVDTDPELVAALRSIKSEAAGVRSDLDELRHRQSEDRQQLRFLRTLLVAKFITLVLLVILLLQVFDLIARIDDCTTIGGDCAQNNAASTQLVVLSASYQAEVQRLTTEIQVGERTGNAPDALAVRRQRLNEVSTVLAKIGENLQDIREGRRPRNEIPTELALDPASF